MGLRCGEGAVWGRHRTGVVRACPVGVRFGACAPCTQPSAVIPTPPEAPSVTVATPRLASDRTRLRGALRTVVLSPWPSPFVVARVAARRLRVGRAAAGRTVRVGGVVALASVALIWETDRSPTGSASGASVRRAFADVAGAVRRAGAPEPRTDASGVGQGTRPTAPAHAAADVVSVRRGRRQRRGARRRVPLGFPVRGPVSSPFGLRVHPVTGGVHLHRGVDLAVPVGTPVVATAPGRVASVGLRGGYGLVVEVDHRSRSPLSISTLYAHLSELPAGLRVGLVVRRGSVVGFSGGVGAGAGLSTGPHVHYEVRRGGRAVDPASAARVVWTLASAQSRGVIRRLARGGGTGSSPGDRRRPTRRGVP